MDLILGVAGHIDHGKTALVRALTGTDTDRLPEEQRRGITIELGFAELVLDDVRLGVIDVPGHERFIRTMLAGATGVDLALLVVAADDAVKPQTREHLEILQLLDLRAGVIALTKCDLSTPAWLELVEAEVRELTADTFLRDAPLVRTSVITGEGLSALCDALKLAARHGEATAPGKQNGPFRMGIDRCFTVAGYGTVVTGSVVSGCARIGDALSLEPGGREVRIRALQQHDRSVEQIHGGQRAAINLAGISHHEICRGQELATPGYLLPSTLLTAELQLLSSAPRPMKTRGRVRVHLGTRELLASVALLAPAELAPGETAVAQLFLSEQVVAVWRQPLVIRSIAPPATIGGGHVLDPTPRKLRADAEHLLDDVRRLAADDPLERAGASLALAQLEGWAPAALPQRIGVGDAAPIVAALQQRGELLVLQLSPSRQFYVHRAALEVLADQVVRALSKFHRDFPLQRSMPPARLEARFAYLATPALLEAALDHLLASQRIECAGQGITLVGQGPQLSGNEQKTLAQIIAVYRGAGVQPPTLDELAALMPRNKSAAPQLVQLAQAEGILVRIDADFLLHHEVEQEIRTRLRAAFEQQPQLTVSEIRVLLGTTRKYAVPLCEYLDQIGFTQRTGDVRQLRKDDE